MSMNIIQREKEKVENNNDYPVEKEKNYFDIGTIPYMAPSSVPREAETTVQIAIRANF